MLNIKVLTSLPVAPPVRNRAMTIRGTIYPLMNKDVLRVLYIPDDIGADHRKCIFRIWLELKTEIVNRILYYKTR